MVIRTRDEEVSADLSGFVKSLEVFPVEARRRRD